MDGTFYAGTPPPGGTGIRLVPPPAALREGTGPVVVGRYSREPRAPLPAAFVSSRSIVRDARPPLRRYTADVEIRFAALADYAAVDPQGRVNIIGLFSEFYAMAFPLQVPNLHVALSFSANAFEAGSTKALRLVMQDQDGKEMLAMDGQIGVPQPVRPGRPILINICLGIHNLAIPTEGSYQVCVLINGETKSVLEFSALLTPNAGPA